MQALRDDGLVYAIPQRGTYVTPEDQRSGK
jgi:hypothetical protein